MGCCEMQAPDLYRNKHFLVIVDRCTGQVWTYNLRHRKDLWKKVHHFIESLVDPFHANRRRELLVEWEKARKSDKVSGGEAPSLSGLRTIRTDCGTEFKNAKMVEMLKSKGVKFDTVPPYKKDGRAERMIRTVVALLRTTMIEANLRKCFWGPVLDMAVYTHSRVYSLRLQMTPHEALTGLKPNVGYFRQPGCLAACHIMAKDRRKLDKAAFIGILIKL